jgi:prophage regulatory protein
VETWDSLGYSDQPGRTRKSEFCQMAQRLIPYESLKAKCIGYSKPHLWRLEKANKFPKRVAIGAGRYGYVESEIDAYIEQKIAERDAGRAA